MRRTCLNDQKNFQEFLLLAFSVSSHDITAIAGQDYTAILNQPITFTSSGPTEQDLVVQISSDDLVEGTESFLLTVSSQNLNTKIGNNENTTVRIIDQDGMLFYTLKCTSRLLLYCTKNQYL